jgi:hypothetical protein
MTPKLSMKVASLSKSLPARSAMASALRLRFSTFHRCFHGLQRHEERGGISQRHPIAIA